MKFAHTICVAASLTCLAAPAAAQRTCDDYALDAASVYSANVRVARCAQMMRDDLPARWHADRTAHLRWCRGVSQKARDSETVKRNELIRRCRGGSSL